MEFGEEVNVANLVEVELSFIHEPVQMDYAIKLSQRWKDAMNSNALVYIIHKFVLR